MKTFITNLTKNLRKFDNPARIELATSPMFWNRALYQ